MGLINNQSVFIGPPLSEGDSRTITNFRDDDDFSIGLFDESINLPSFPENVGIAFIRSSNSPADYATITLNGTDTSMIYFDNTEGSVNLDVSGNLRFNVKNALTLTKNNTLTFHLASDTALTISARGSDGVIRYANITLTPPVP